MQLNLKLRFHNNATYIRENPIKIKISISKDYWLCKNILFHKRIQVHTHWNVVLTSMSIATN